LIAALRAAGTKPDARAGRAEKGLGGNECPPRPRFFAAANFRASKAGTSLLLAYFIYLFQTDYLHQ